MTKDWDAVQDEIKELSFNQKKPLEEVKKLMERKHKFRASTRAYRMKLKEWGLMRHKPRKAIPIPNEGPDASLPEIDEPSQRDRDSSVTVEPMSLETTPATSSAACAVYRATGNEDTEMLPTFMSLLTQPRDLRPTFDPWSEARTRASEIVLDMLGAVLDKHSERLEKLVVQNIQHINDPIGQPFDSPNSRFFGHPALNQMVILQHPDQTILDIACGMPDGPVIWVLLSHGAKGSRHPLGSDLALHNAIKNGRPYTVQALLVPGRSDVNGVPGSNWQPLRQAVFWNVPEVVRMLLSRGANIEDSGPSPLTIDADHTALQLCLESRARKYKDLPAKERCHQILKELLDAGANIHVKSAKGSTETVFQMFIRPWQSNAFWSSRPTPTELECFKALLEKDADTHVPFDGFPCGSPSSKTFEHQVLWHSTPAMARFLVDNFVQTPQNNGSILLHEILGSCPDAKRHPADTLRDIEVLIQKGISPDRPDDMGTPPLKKCIQLCPAVDIVPRLQALLDGGADPDFPDQYGDAAWIVAARAFEEPLLSEVMHIVVAKIKGSIARYVDDVNYNWDDGRFPIPANQTYEQVMSSTRDTGDFMLHLRDMVPEDIQATFQRAYFSIVSKSFLDSMTKTAKARILSENEKKEIVWILSMREDMNLPQYVFDQELVMALLDPQTFFSVLLDTAVTRRENTSAASEGTITSTAPSPHTTATTVSANPSSPTPHAHFQFNPNGAASPSSLPKAAEQNDSAVEDFFIPTTTQIRWLNPDVSISTQDMSKATKYVVQYKCDTCNNGNLLTERELKRHKSEHEHTASCKIEGCTRRFCVDKRRRMARRNDIDVQNEQVAEDIVRNDVEVNDANEVVMQDNSETVGNIPGDASRTEEVVEVVMRENEGTSSTDGKFPRIGLFLFS